MNDWPEMPIQVLPSLIRRLGTDEALLLSVLHQYAGYHALGTQEPPECVLALNQWRALADFWDENKHWAIAQSLVRQQVLRLEQHSGRVRFTLLSWPITDTTPTAATLPVYSAPPPSRHPPLQPEPRPTPSATLSARGPAPTFGGHSGWRHQKDELQALFDEHEQRNRRMLAMHLGWQPSTMFFELLPRHAIPESFARECLDEFVLYWMDQDKRESNWDQKFLGWVKREWVKRQAREAREQRFETSNTMSKTDENTRRDTRENRKRVTAAIMDIKDTDW
ncbi:DnaT-like ssDNA-binding domain-containing protein [Nitrincola tapanii]|uniref:DnaT DNA-binding domain-containing protein n=1 Tax=Nitrincola tapanii TaxID=1708751 RepID=A0A5A9W603_9GAMM|nr:DnaT-like ssDNA-binding domain-containing protein [Nitrincola tapanii]KAA0874971.1 hypothetical protein E1H14_05980 [Nitrincola tapanii]